MYSIENTGVLFPGRIHCRSKLGPMVVGHPYRVRARNARIRAMRRTLLIATCKNKAAQQRIIAIII
jgi:hypothetical protein